MTQLNGSMFVLVPQRTAWWPVAFTVPAEDDAGYVTQQTIEMKFRFIDDGALTELTQKAGTIDASSTLTPAQKIAEVYMGIVADWRGVGESKDKPLPFTRDNFAMLLQSLPGFDRRALLPAYIECLGGEGKVRSGN